MIPAVHLAERDEVATSRAIVLTSHVSDWRERFR
jgi:hypothetical protein